MKIYDYTIVKSENLASLVEKVQKCIHEKEWQPQAGVTVTTSGLYIQVLVKVMEAN
jgi:hypothetical protein